MGCMLIVIGVVILGCAVYAAEDRQYLRTRCAFLSGVIVTAGFITLTVSARMDK